MGWLGTRRKKTSDDRAEEENAAHEKNGKRGRSKVSGPPLVLLVPDIAGVSSYRIHPLADAPAAKEFVQTSLSWQKKSGISIHAFWALQQRPEAAAEGDEAMVLIRTAPGSELVYVVSFVDIESAQSFARFEVKRGLGLGLIMIYWASLVTITENEEGVVVSPEFPPRVALRSWGAERGLGQATTMMNGQAHHAPPTSPPAAEEPDVAPIAGSESEPAAATVAVPELTIESEPRVADVAPEPTVLEAAKEAVIEAEVQAPEITEAPAPAAELGVESEPIEEEPPPTAEQPSNAVETPAPEAVVSEPEAVSEVELELESAIEVEAVVAEPQAVSEAEPELEPAITLDEIDAPVAEEESFLAEPEAVGEEVELETAPALDEIGAEVVEEIVVAEMQPDAVLESDPEIETPVEEEPLVEELEPVLYEDPVVAESEAVAEVDLELEAEPELDETSTIVEATDIEVDLPSEAVAEVEDEPEPLLTLEELGRRVEAGLEAELTPDLQVEPLALEPVVEPDVLDTPEEEDDEALPVAESEPGLEPMLAFEPIDIGVEPDVADEEQPSYGRRVDDVPGDEPAVEPEQLLIVPPEFLRRRVEDGLPAQAAASVNGSKDEEEDEVAVEVEKILGRRRWEKRDSPFKGFDSPPGRF